MMLPRLVVPALAATAALALPGCASSPYTGPVEVTRFIAPDPAGLGQGTITLAFPDAIDNQAARIAFADAVRGELTRLGYTVVPEGASAAQTAAIRTARRPIAAAPVERRGPVNVGVGAGGGSFGGGGFGGVGVGLGINLGGGREDASVNTQLEVRITATGGATLWEGRAELATGVKSPYSAMALSARTLAAGLFRDFPGGNGETVAIDAKKLQGAK